MSATTANVTDTAAKRTTSSPMPSINVALVSGMVAGNCAQPEIGRDSACATSVVSISSKYSENEIQALVAQHGR